MGESREGEEMAESDKMMVVVSIIFFIFFFLFKFKGTAAIIVCLYKCSL